MNLLAAILLFNFISLPANADKAIEEVVVGHITSFMQQYYPVDEYRVQVELRRIPNFFETVQNHQIEGVQFRGNGIPSGYSVFDVNLNNRVRNPQSNVQAFIRIKRHLPVPTSRIVSGDMLSASQFTTAWVDITRQSGNFITDAQDFEGKVAGRILREGVPVRASELRRIPIIQAGELVTMIYQQGNLAIQVQGVARQDGAAGDKIRVHSEETRKTYTATVQADGTLVWNNTL